MTKVRPVFKWAGGKRQLLPELRKHIPVKFGTYHEPFVGGGALFFDVAPKHAVLNDMNARLMQTYTAIRDYVELVIGRLRDYQTQHYDWKTRGRDRELFEIVRAADINAQGPIQVAAWMIFLNKLCFNGLYRVNKHGQFNVPYGRYKKTPLICDAENLRAASEALTRITLRSGDFRFACADAKRGDLVYFDPPYLPISDTSDFTGYTPGGFGLYQHEQLCDTARALKRRGVHVIVSNSAAPAIRSLYAKGFDIHEVSGKRAINSKGDRRGAVGELIIT
jgi:DNA adenine methylase